jgi:Flp pilus assembly protein TadB
MLEEITLRPTITHAETAWLTLLPPLMLSALIVLLVSFLLRARLTQDIIAWQIRHALRRRQALPTGLIPDSALAWSPHVVRPELALTISALLTSGLAIVLSLLLAPWLALILSVPLLLVLTFLVLHLAERRYRALLDRDLVAAVGRLSALLKSGNSFRGALDKLLNDSLCRPLAAEWGFLLERQGTPLSETGGIATAQHLVQALAVQTRSPRHAAFLNHLAVAVGQPQDVLIKRCEAAYEALQSSERRREAALTELAQMRYSGIAVSLSGTFMAGYLAWTQWDRLVMAYSSLLGSIVAVIVVTALLLPFIGGLWLSRVEDVDY